MAERKFSNRFTLQESGPILLLVVVVIVGVSLWFNRQERQSQESNIPGSFEDSLYSEVASPLEGISESPGLDQSAMSISNRNSNNTQPTSVMPTTAGLPLSQSATLSSLDSNAQLKKTFTIQVHSFQDQTKAEKDLANVLKEGYSGFVMRKELKEKGTWYRVCIGEFESKNQADQELVKIKQKYKDSFVIVR